MLLLPVRLLDQEPRALRMLQDAYRHVLVDEVQDTCRLQYGLLRRIADVHRNLALVGDPLQSVYSFRGADPSLLEAFSHDYPDARVYVLDENHRSTATIVALANAIAEPLAARHASWTSNPQGPVARLYRARDELDEARYVAEAIVKLLNERQITAAGQAAVLFRTNIQARAMADALRARGIAIQMRADGDLFIRTEVRDLLAYLRLAHNPHDGPALARVLDTPPRRLRDIERAFRKHPVPIADLPAHAERRGGRSAKEAVEGLLKLLDELHTSTAGQKPFAVLETILERTAYAVWLASQKDGPSRLQHVEQLHSLLQHTQTPDLGTWLADMHLGEADPEPDQHAVSLLTVHAAKGREWPVVFLVGIEEGLLPHTLSHGSTEVDLYDEERRLTYVALSRCQVMLYLTYCETRRRTDGAGVGSLDMRKPSRYLRALPPNLVHVAS
jgi:DNA helicase-2/ATP-dependent DNA helicase PcrA